MTRRWKKLWKQACRGAVTVEMALVLPIFTMLVFGIIEFGRGFMIMQLVTNAAREGCRRAIIDGSTNSDVIQTFMQASGNVPTSATAVTITVTPATGNPGNSLASCASRDLITVKVDIPFITVQLISTKYLAGKTLTGQASIRHG